MIEGGRTCWWGEVAASNVMQGRREAPCGTMLERPHDRGLLLLPPHAQVAIMFSCYEVRSLEWGATALAVGAQRT